MKKIHLLFAAAITIAACNTKSGEKTDVTASFCKDSACISNPIRFDDASQGHPFVNIQFKDCRIDSIHWEKGGMGSVKDIVFSDFITKPFHPSKSFISCDIIDGKFAYLRMNDCPTGRGYILKLPFEKGGAPTKLTSAINNFDPKYKVEDGLIAYYDNTFIYVEDIHTGKVAKTLLTDTGVKEIDYDLPHSLVDSVNITHTNIYAKLIVNEKEKINNAALNFK